MTQIEDAISRVTGVSSQMKESTAEIVKKFYEFSDVFQVKVGELAKNPFLVEGYLKDLKGDAVVAQDPREQAELFKRQRLQQQASTLRLVSVMESGTGNSCMINDRFPRSGDKIEEFTVGKTPVTCRAREVRRALRVTNRTVDYCTEADAIMLRFLSHPKDSKSRGAPGPGPEPEDNARPSTVAVYPEDDEVRGLCDLYSPEPTGQVHVHDVADVLLEMKKITDEQYGRFRRESMTRPGLDPTAVLLKDGLANANDILEAKAKLNGLEFRRIAGPVERDAGKPR
jgi:hypothetical protein